MDDYSFCPDRASGADRLGEEPKRGKRVKGHCFSEAVPPTHEDCVNGKDAPSLQPDDVKQANRLLNELQGAKLIGKDKRRTPGTFEHSLLAGHAAAIAPVGANGEVAYAAAMKQRGIEQQHTYAVWSWIVRGANKTETVCLTVAAQTAPPRLLANS